jgi:hypothetical protein
MAVITVTEVNSILGITGSADNSFISTYIPYVEIDLLHICNNDFFEGGIYQSGTYTFDSSAGSITSKGGNSFATDGFVDGDEILIRGSYRNDGLYVIGTVSTSVITVTKNVSSAETVTEELSGASIIITLVQWPLRAKLAVAKMLQYRMNNKNSMQGTYYYYGYPSDIMSYLDDIRIPRVM